MMLSMLLFIECGNGDQQFHANRCSSLLQTVPEELLLYQSEAQGDEALKIVISGSC